MGKCVIDKENVVAPGRCHLILDVDETRLGVTVIDPIVSDPLWRSIELTPALSPSRGAGFVESGSEALVKSLEEAVYDNPVLLSGFSSVEVILHTPWFAMVPPEISADAEMRMTVAEASVPEEAADATMIELPPLSAEAPDFVMYADTRLVDFLRRTFANPMFRHPLEVMCRYFMGTDPLGVSGKMLARFAPRRVDLMAFGNSGPVFANSFECMSPVDAVYFILAVRESLGIGVNGELLLAGDASMREAVTPVLRKYIGFAMPLPLPSRIVAGNVAMPFHTEALAVMYMKNINNPADRPSCE
ncbi:DUF3822 family protein [Muribaculum intestinale]|uniref:DUF3822 family protein n=1 Tax=Muribaculum intestinale TaxID=1796646 RepID=UPI00272FEEC8|nr:DUF3822 family protein [Muribaculum intestinale]